MEKLERLLYVLNAVLIELEDFSENNDEFCNEELAEIRHQLELIKDNVWRLTN